MVTYLDGTEILIFGIIYTCMDGTRRTGWTAWVRFPNAIPGTRNLLSNGYRGLSPGVTRPGREADHSPSRTEAKKRGAIRPFPHTPS
jgi:hypothetical protein